MIGNAVDLNGRGCRSSDRARLEPRIWGKWTSAQRDSGLRGEKAHEQAKSQTRARASRGHTAMCLLALEVRTARTV